MRGSPASAVIDQIIHAAPAWLARLDELPFDERRIHKLRRAIEYRLRCLQ